MNRPGNILLFVVFALLPWHGQAQLYKWVDENGEVHFSDKAPDDGETSSVVPGEQGNKVQYTGASGKTTRPIIRSYDEPVRRLHLPDIRYLWKNDLQAGQSEKIGIYHVGKACTTRGAIKAPDVFIRHKSMLPAETRLTFSIKQVIKELEYDAERTEHSRLQERLGITGGLSLHSEIVAMNFKACAPNISDSSRLKPIETVAAHRFTRSRVRLRIRWQLRENRDQDVVFEAVTQGEYNGWNQSNPPRHAIGSAVAAAAMNLFSNQKFVAMLIGENAASTQASSAPESTEAGMPSSVNKRFLIQARMAQAFSEINTLKVYSMHHYASEGEWPGDLSVIGFTESMFYDSDTIASVSLKSDGSIVAELKEVFGNGKTITLQPEDGENSVSIKRWRCFSNLDKAYLPQTCRGR